MKNHKIFLLIASLFLLLLSACELSSAPPPPASTPPSVTAPEAEPQISPPASSIISVKKKEVSKGDTVVFIEGNEAQGTNRLVLETKGKQIELASGKTRLLNADGSDAGALFHFTDIKLNSDGRYLLVFANAWEVSIGDVYDLQAEDKKPMKRFLGTEDLDFTPDGKFVYGCASNAFGGEYYGEIIELASNKKVYEVPKSVFDGAFNGNEFQVHGECKMEGGNIVAFTADRHDRGDKFVENFATLRFDLNHQ